VDAHNLAGEITACILKLHTETPSILTQRHKFPATSLTSSSESTGLRLKLSTPLPYSITKEDEDPIDSEEWEEEEEQFDNSPHNPVIKEKEKRKNNN
jgi:hypothetical protein